MALPVVASRACRRGFPLRPADQTRRHGRNPASRRRATPPRGARPGLFNEKLFLKGDRPMMRQFQANSYLFGGNAPYVEDLYERYLDNPGSVPDKWRAYFAQMQLVPAADGAPSSRDVPHGPIVESLAQRAQPGAFQQKGRPTDLSGT